MYYDYKAVYNPFNKEFKVACSSPITNMGEEYVIKSKGIMLLPEPVARVTAREISREVLRKKGKEFDDLSRPGIEEDLLSHQFEIKDIGVGSTEEEPPIEEEEEKK